MVFLTIGSVILNSFGTDSSVFLVDGKVSCGFSGTTFFRFPFYEIVALELRTFFIITFCSSKTLLTASKEISTVNLGFLEFL